MWTVSCRCFYSMGYFRIKLAVVIQIPSKLISACRCSLEKSAGCRSRNTVAFFLQACGGWNFCPTWTRIGRLHNLGHRYKKHAGITPLRSAEKLPQCLWFHSLFKKKTFFPKQIFPHANWEKFGDLGFKYEVSFCFSTTFSKRYACFFWFNCHHLSNWMSAHLGGGIFTWSCSFNYKTWYKN